MWSLPTLSNHTNLSLVIHTCIIMNVRYIYDCVIISFCLCPLTVPVTCYDSYGVGIAQWLERWTHDWKVAGSNPCRSGGRIFFSMVNFLCWLLYQYPFHPHVTAVARKRSRSFCSSGSLQLNMHAPYVCGFAWSDMVHACMEYTMCRDGSSFMWHQPYQRCKYTTLVDIQKCAIKSYSLMQNHMQAQWVCSRAETSAV